MVLLLARPQLPASQSDEVSQNASGIVSITCVNAKEIPLLSSPATSAAIGEVKCGEQVSVLEEKDAWDKIRTVDGRVGYVSQYFVSTKTVAQPVWTLVTAPPSNDPKVRMKIAENLIKMGRPIEAYEQACWR